MRISVVVYPHHKQPAGSHMVPLKLLAVDLVYFTTPNNFTIYLSVIPSAKSELSTCIYQIFNFGLFHYQPDHHLPDSLSVRSGLFHCLPDLVSFFTLPDPVYMYSSKLPISSDHYITTDPPADTSSSPPAL